MRKSSARKSMACPAIRSTRARSTPMCLIWRARKNCWRATDVDLSAVRHAQCAHAGRHLHLGAGAAASPITNSSACTAWVKRCTTRSIGESNLDKPCRIYAPVGSHETLLAYLVRRLLENGANSSFVNQIVDEKVPIDSADRRSVRRGAQQLGGAAASAASRLPAAVVRRRAQEFRRHRFEQRRRAARDRRGVRAIGAQPWHAQPLLDGSVRCDREPHSRS